MNNKIALRPSYWASVSGGKDSLYMLNYILHNLDRYPLDGSVKIGAYRFLDRKKPCLCVEKGNTCTVYGSFIDTDRANEFMNELAALVGARDDKEVSK